MSWPIHLNVRSKPGTIHFAAETGNIPLLQKFVKDGEAKGLAPSVILREREELLGSSPMHLAAEAGHVDTIKYLLSQTEGKVLLGDNNGVTPLHLAAVGGHADVCYRLLASGADPSARDEEGDTPLQWAATKADAQVVRILAEANPQAVRQTNAKGWAPVHRAAVSGRKEVLEQLVTRFCADLNVPTADAAGNTPTHLAAASNQLGVLDVLLRLGADASRRNLRGLRPYDVCLSDAARDLLIQYGGPDAGPSEEVSAAAASSSSAPMAGPGTYTRLDEASAQEGGRKSSRRKARDADAKSGSHRARGSDEEGGKPSVDGSRGEAGEAASGSRHSSSRKQQVPGPPPAGSPLPSARRSFSRLPSATSPSPGAGPPSLAGSGAPLPPLRPGSSHGSLTSPSTAGAAGGSSSNPASLPSSSDFQDRVREDNRRAMAVASGEASLLLGGSSQALLSSGGALPSPIGSGSGTHASLGPVRASTSSSMPLVLPTTGRNLSASLALLNASSSGTSGPHQQQQQQQVLKRPLSANKKFLSRYSLDRLNLFAP